MNILFIMMNMMIIIEAHFEKIGNPIYTGLYHTYNYFCKTLHVMLDRVLNTPSHYYHQLVLAEIIKKSHFQQSQPEVNK